MLRAVPAVGRLLGLRAVPELDDLLPLHERAVRREPELRAVFPDERGVFAGERVYDWEWPVRAAGEWRKWVEGKGMKRLIIVIIIAHCIHVFTKKKN